MDNRLLIGSRLVIGLCLALLIHSSMAIATLTIAKLQLTPQELAWLDEHKEIRLGVDPAWPPIEFITEENGYQGVTSEYISILREQLKVRMAPLPGLSWAEVHALVRGGKLDLLPAVSKTPERLSYLNFTKPYLSFPFVVYSRRGTPFLNGLEDLAGKRVAVEAAYAVREMMVRDYPDLELVLVADPLDGLKRLSLGEVDAYTGSLVVGSYLIHKEGLANVKVAAPSTYRFELSMGVRKDWPELIPILQQVLDSLSEEEKMAISQKWLRIRYDLGVDYRLVWEVLLGSLVVLFLGALWLLQMRRQKEALRISEERYHLAMDAVSEAVWEWDLSTDKRYFSAGFFYHLGYSEAEIPDNDEAWQALIQPLDRPRFNAENKRHITDRDQAEQPLVMEYRVRNKQGEYVVVQSRGKVVKWDAAGNAVLRRGTLRDISAQKLVESELRKLSLAVEHSPSMVIITDTQGNIEYVNEKFTEVAGFTASEVTGQNARILQSGLTANSLYRDLWTTVSSGGEWRGEIQNRKKNGEIYWEFMSISPVRDARGVITHYVSLKEDITVRKEAERMTAAAREKAEEANRFKSDFLANMSHEIRTPMNAIIGLAHLALQTDLNSKQYDYIHKIKVAAYNLLGLIKDILDFSKIEAGKLEIEETEFQLDKLLDNLAGMVSLRAKEKGLDIHFKRDRNVPNALIGDPLRLGQVLTNLLQNAIKFTDQGQVIVAVDLLEIQHEYAEIAFTVTDTGIGIKSERIPQLFEAFVQADSSTSRQHGGTGLGLSICKQLVELMAGKLSVRSRPGEGSSFRFVLKLGLPQDASEAVSDPKTKLPGEDTPGALSRRLKGKVLLVEDNLINQLVARELLENFGLRVFIAKEGGEAIAQLHGSDFDLVMMDIQMPGMDGYQATRAIRADGGFSGLPIIAMTAYAMAEDEDRCLAAGMNDYLSKPVDPERLWEVLRTWLPSETLDETVSDREMEHAQAVAGNLPGIDLEWVNRYVGGNRRLLAKLLKNFNHYHRDCCARIDKALAEGDVTEAQHITHTLQGVSGSVGARDLQNAAQTLDVAIRELSPTVIEDRKQKFCAEAMKVFRGLEGLQGQWEAADELGPSRREYGDSASADKIMSIIDQLSGYLQGGDTEAKVLLKALQVVVDISDKEIQELMSQLQGQVAEYDYDDALTTLRTLQEWYANKLMRSDNHG